MNSRHFHAITVLALAVFSGCRHTTTTSPAAGREQRVVMSKVSLKAGRYEVSITNRGTSSIYYLYEPQREYYEDDRLAHFGAAPNDEVWTSGSIKLLHLPTFYTRKLHELKPGAVAFFTGYAPKHISAPSHSNRWSIRFQWQDSVETDSSHFIESARIDF